MLNKIEEKILLTIKSFCSDNNACLITPTDIIRVSGLSCEINEKLLEDILKSLSFDDYLDIVYSSRKGEKVYCITLHEKGFAYQRNKTVLKRDLKYKFIITVGFAILSFLIGLVLRAIFS